MTLQKFEERLKDACPDLVFELAGPKGCHRYVCWHRYGRSSTYGDNVNQIDAPKVQIDIRNRQVNNALNDGEESA